MTVYRVKITFETYVEADDSEEAYDKAMYAILETNDNDVCDYDIGEAE